MPFTVPEPWAGLATALALGLLIGTERGFSGRRTPELQMAAGIRTFALLGLLGGLATLLSGMLGLAVWVATALVVGVLVVVSYLSDVRRNGDQGMTTEMAMLATFLLGSLAVLDSAALAAALAVVVALLLSLKTVLHDALQRLTADEVSGALKLLFISLVLLPILPNQGYGPWQVFNPYVVWWMVVLLAGIGFAAYVAVRLAGARRGLLFTSLLGGLVSSTAMTLTLARLGSSRSLHGVLAAGLLATSGLMFPRVLAEVALVNRSLLTGLWLPLTVAGLVYLLGALYCLWRSARVATDSLELPLKNPFELGPALRFAGLLALILLLVEAARHLLGDTGIYLIAVLSGMTDVDAITLSLSRSARGELDNQVAILGIYLAVLSNSLVKAALIGLIGGWKLALATVPVMLGGLMLGLLVLTAT